MSLFSASGDEHQVTLPFPMETSIDCIVSNFKNVLPGKMSLEFAHLNCIRKI